MYDNLQLTEDLIIYFTFNLFAFIIFIFIIIIIIMICSIISLPVQYCF